MFDEVAELYHRARPPYPDALFRDLAAIAGLDPRSRVLEVGCGTGLASGPLAALGCQLTAIEPGAALAALARHHLRDRPNVTVENAAFETWDPGDRRFTAVVAASSWHWVDPAVSWRRAHDLLDEGGWLALAGAVVVRRAGDIEIYAHTADLHERYAPGNPDWGHPPSEAEVLATGQGWGPPNEDGDGLFGPTTVRWYPMKQHLDGAGFAALAATLSPYRRLPDAVREPLLDAIAERIRNRLGDRVTRRYLGVLRMGRRRAG